MRVKILFFVSLIVMCFACAKENKTTPHLENCPILENFKILTETERQNACHYLDLYLYQSAIYSICECCVCDKEALILNCNGETLKNVSYLDFYTTAVYLYAVQEEN